jgi:hypothetical protein
MLSGLSGAYILDADKISYGVVQFGSQCIYSPSLGEYQLEQIFRLAGIECWSRTPPILHFGSGRREYKFTIGLAERDAVIYLSTMEEIRPFNVFEQELVERLLNCDQKQHFESALRRYDWDSSLPSGIGLISQPFGPSEAIRMLQYSPDSPLEITKVRALSVLVRVKELIEHAT